MSRPPEEDPVRTPGPGTARKPGPGTARSAGSRRELGTRTARDAQHEDRVNEVLARYYRAAGRAERIRVAGRRRAARVTATARRRADAINAGAAREAAVPDAEAHSAMRELYRLVGGRAEVAELCGLTVKAAGDILSAPAGATPPRDAGPGPAARPGEDDDSREDDGGSRQQ